MKLKFKMSNRGTIAISQIALLIISIFAITFLISLTIPNVKASSCTDNFGTCEVSPCTSSSISLGKMDCDSGKECCSFAGSGGGAFGGAGAGGSWGSTECTQDSDCTDGKKCVDKACIKDFPLIEKIGQIFGNYVVVQGTDGILRWVKKEIAKNKDGTNLGEEQLGKVQKEGTTPTPIEPPETKPTGESTNIFQPEITSTFTFPENPTIGQITWDPSTGGWIYTDGNWENYADTNGIPTDKGVELGNKNDKYYRAILESLEVPILKATFGSGLKYVFGLKGGAISSTSGGSIGGAIVEGGSVFWATTGAIIGIVIAAAAAVALVHYGLDLLGASERNVRGATNAAIIAGSVSATVASVLVSLVAAGVLTGGLGGIGFMVAIITIEVAGYWILFNYQDYSMEIFSYIPSLWQPIYGGEKCEQCNELDSGCNEYQCHTFGTACELINQGSKYPTCVARDGGIDPPEIQPLESALQPDYAYTPLAVNLPSDRGARIIYYGSNSDENECVPAFTPLTLGVNTSQPAQCRIDLERKQSFSDMLSFMAEGNLYTYNHTFFLPSSSLPSASAIEALNLSLANGNEYSFFIRCLNINGIESTMHFEMQFCVQDGPDTMAPEILYSNYLDAEACISTKTTTSPIEIYTNEPADCRWDFNDVDYEDMFYSMTCSQTLADRYPAGSMTYGCTGTLEGIKESVQNNYYIKCKDQPWLEGKEDALGQRNSNKDAYVVMLQGSESLIIDEVTINDEENNAYIKDSTDTIKIDLVVNTLAGCSEGNARCAHGEIRGSQVLYTDFYNEGSFEFTPTNTETFYLAEGNYSIPIRCTDEGGNIAETQANFTIETDLTAPVVTRAYYEDNYLKLITSEEAECVYSADSCTYEFEDGSEISTSNGIDHFLTWDTTLSLYVKCKDEFSNRPPANKCNIVVQPYDKRNA